MLSKEAWAKEAEPVHVQIDRLLKLIYEDESYTPELYRLLHRTGLYDRIVESAIKEVVIEEKITGGVSEDLTQDPAQPEIDWFEDEGKRKVEVTNLEIAPNHGDFRIAGKSTHVFDVEIAHKLAGHGFSLDAQARYIQMYTGALNDDVGFNLPSLPTEWQRLIGDDLASDIGNSYAGVAGGHVVDRVEIVEATPVEGSDTIEGPNYDEWYALNWVLTVEVTWSDFFNIDEMMLEVTS